MAQPLPTGTVVLDSTLEGLLRFVPSSYVFRTIGDDDEADLVDVAGRTVRLDGRPISVVLEANDGPAAPLETHWTAIFDTETPVPDLLFTVPAGATVNLAELVSLVTAPGIVKVVSDEDRRAAEAAAAYVRTALTNHIDDPTPHPAYDEMPDLSDYYTNRKEVLS